MALFGPSLQDLDTCVAREYEVLNKVAAEINHSRFSRVHPKSPRCSMDIDGEKLEQTVLALLHLTSYTVHHRLRAWKGHDWQVMNLLYEKGYISDPTTKAKSVELTEEGAKLSKELFEKLFAKK
jgi:Domain of unknown function (DUF6429)